jgi:hypothetical protein
MPRNFPVTGLAGWMLLATLVSAGTGCRTSISPGELLGTWTISRTSQHLFPAEFDVSTATLVLNPDRTFTGTGLPQELVVFVPTPGDAAIRINGSGRWEVLQPRRLGAPTQLMLEFKTIQGPGKYQLPFSTMITSVEKTSGGVTLFYFHDDPDLGRRVDFEKQK